MIALAIYCFVSATTQLLLGIGWSAHDPVHRAIKFLFLFLAVWGAFFGALVIKRLM